MSDPDAIPDEDDGDVELLTIEITPEWAGERLDRALAALLPDLSRARLQALMAAGAVSRDGQPVSNASAKAEAGAVYVVEVPPVISAVPEPQDLDLTVLYEDEHLIVVDKPAGMAAHPAPGTPDGTLVNALLFHCGKSLSGIGGVARPGIVHRLDKDTSGVMVAAKTDAAHKGLAALFAAHDIERAYIAFLRGRPAAASGTLTTRIGRARFDRQRMAVLKSGGREAITHYKRLAVYGPADRPLASKVECRLETGRTHQIRVHMAHLGAPCLGDPLYGSALPSAPVRRAMEEAGLKRQALHAAILGFVHPITGEALRFETLPPSDMQALETALGDT